MHITDCGCDSKKALDDVLDKMHENVIALMTVRDKAEEGTVDPHHSEYTKEKFNEIYQIIDLLLEGQ